MASTPTLVFVAIGPGEVAGWAIPIARELRRGADAGSLRLILALSPSQFASGTEAAMAARTGYFSQIVPPAECFRLALGLSTLPLGNPAALLHLGGDHWFSRRLARRWGIPAFAYAETERIVRYRQAFREIFVPYPRVAALLAARAVDPARVHVVGDPRLDTLPARGNPQNETRPTRTVLLAGSRARTVRGLFPLWVETALALRRLRPGDEIAIAIPPDLREPAVEGALAPWRARLAAAGVSLIWEPAAPAIAEADLVVTIPGTTTMEVAAVPVTAIVVAPAQLAGAVTLEGAAEWLVRFPLVGRAIRRSVALRWAGTKRYVSLPNLLTDRPILPEVVGVVTPAALAAQAADLLADEPRRRRIEQALEDAVGPRGGAARIAQHLLGILSLRPAAVEAGV